MKRIAIAYLQGALGDGTYSKLHKTYRVSQKDIEWLCRLRDLLRELRHKAWIYKEGKKRNLYVLETTAKFLSLTFAPELLRSNSEKRAYVRGYFDAEGGIPRIATARFYVQFTQKKREGLKKVRDLLEGLGVRCGRIHVPSIRVAPDYWRFFVRAQSYKRFMEVIGSWHPRKERLLSDRMKI